MCDQNPAAAQVPTFLHRNLEITSDKQRSSQGSVFYFKFNQNSHQPDEDALMQCDNSDSQPSNEEIECILKVYPKDELETFDKEHKILSGLGKYQMQGFPKLISAMKSQLQAEMVLEALGPNLRHLEEATPKRHFSKTTVFLIGIQLIERIRDLHAIGWVHNDIKLENILIGYRDPSKIYLIDYLNFVQQHIYNYIRHSLESIFYLMIYLYNNNYLPWRDFKGTFKQMVIQRLQLKITKSLFKMIPPCLEECLKYVLLLNYDEEPKYDFLIEELKKAYNYTLIEYYLFLSTALRANFQILKQGFQCYQREKAKSLNQFYPINLIIEQGEKFQPNIFKAPVFDWNVSLATRFQKVLQDAEDHWRDGEASLSQQNLSVLNLTLLKSRLTLNHLGSNMGSFGSHTFISPMNSNDIMTDNHSNIARKGSESITQANEMNFNSGKLLIQRSDEAMQDARDCGPDSSKQSEEQVVSKNFNSAGSYQPETKIPEYQLFKPVKRPVRKSSFFSQQFKRNQFQTQGSLFGKMNSSNRQNDFPSLKDTSMMQDEDPSYFKCQHQNNPEVKPLPQDLEDYSSSSDQNQDEMDEEQFHDARDTSNPSPHARMQASSFNKGIMQQNMIRTGEFKQNDLKLQGQPIDKSQIHQL